MVIVTKTLGQMARLMEVTDLTYTLTQALYRSVYRTACLFMAWTVSCPS